MHTAKLLAGIISQDSAMGYVNHGFGNEPSVGIRPPRATTEKGLKKFRIKVERTKTGRTRMLLIEKTPKKSKPKTGKGRKK